MAQKSTSTTVDVEPRRVPRQKRSQRRVDALLDAYASLLTEQGFEAISTHAVAERADVPVGTVYQFFPNKFALATALGRRYMERFDSMIGAELILDTQEMPWSALFDNLVDRVVDILFADPALLRSWMVSQTVPELEVARQESDAFAHRLCGAVLRPRLRHLDEERRHAVIATVNRTIYALLYTASQDPAGARERHVSEMKRMINAYLAPYLESA